MQDFAGLGAGLCGAFGVGCDWCVSVWFGEHALGRVPESRDAFELSCV